MDNKDLDLFRKEMLDVQPLKASGTINFRKATAPTPGQIYRRKTTNSNTLDVNFLPSDFIGPVHPYDLISYKRDGVQNGVYRKLKRGDYPIEAVLDIQRANADKARHEVFRFIADCLEYDVRSALIRHGMGRQKLQSVHPLKSLLVRWLRMFSEVLAYHSAQKHHGGVTAVYILLRKSEKLKEINRRRFGMVK